MQIPEIGFIGAGKMGETIIRRLVNQKLLPPSKIWICDRLPERMKLFKEMGINLSFSIQEVARKTTFIILAVKPQDIKEVLKELRPNIHSSHLLISIAAGITTNYIIGLLRKEIPVVRVMPNTAALIGESISAFSSSRKLTPSQLILIKKLMGVLGEIIEVHENQLDAVTGLSGSGPAYVYSFILGLIQGGVEVGLSRELATKLAIQTTLGATFMAKKTNDSLENLRSAVVSPGGTTAEGLRILQQAGLEQTLALAVKQATQRAKELRK